MKELNNRALESTFTKDTVYINLKVKQNESNLIILIGNGSPKVI